jgi:hypothetical protein
VGDAPTKEDLYQGHPFSSNPNFMTAGRILRKELELMGTSLNDFRTVTLWQHEPTKSEECWQVGYDNILDDAKGKKAILLIGADVVEAFTQYKVSDVSGLQVDSPVLSSPIIYALVNPAVALSRGVGEVRQGIQKFIQRLEAEGLL